MLSVAAGAEVACFLLEGAGLAVSTEEISSFAATETALAVAAEDPKGLSLRNSIGPSGCRIGDINSIWRNVSVIAILWYN